MNIVIRPEAEHDRQAVRSVNQAAFGTASEADLVDALRIGGYVEVSLVAENEDRVVGHILFSNLSIVTNLATVDAVSLAPLAVLPSHQRKCIGSQLVEAGLQACRNRGHRIAAVLGHPEFYQRLGFSAELAGPLKSPFGGGEAWMAIELRTGALEGIEGRVEYPPPFSALI